MPLLQQVNVPSANTYCGNCNAKKAMVRCLDCKEYLCDICHASHRTWKALSDHSFVSMEDILTGKVKLTNEQEEVERRCELHGKVLAYHCKTEGRAVCQDCVILKDSVVANGKQCQSPAAHLEVGHHVERLVSDAVWLVDEVRNEIETNSRLAKESLEMARQDCVRQLEQVVNRHADDIERMKRQKLKELDQTRAAFMAAVRQHQMAAEPTPPASPRSPRVHTPPASPRSPQIHTPPTGVYTPFKFIYTPPVSPSPRVRGSRSKSDVTAAYSTLSEQLQRLFRSNSMGERYNGGAPVWNSTTPILQLPPVRKSTSQQKWNLSEKFDTGDFNRLLGLKFNPNGDIAIASFEKGARVFSRTGDVKCTLYNSPGALSVAITPDHKYVTAPVNVAYITFHDIRGNLLHNYPVTDFNDVPSNVNSVAVDAKGQIIVGQVDNTISIHHPDGSVLSKFETDSEPFRLASTSDGKIVSSFCDPIKKQSLDVRVMDYSGRNVRVIQPPPAVTEWSPGFVCCQQGEIFVVNEGAGDPTGVYRYTSAGEYLGCVTTEVINPEGIALSEDGTELFVAEYKDNMVKIFKRQ